MVCDKIKIFLHNIHLLGMSEFENHFEMYLKQSVLIDETTHQNKAISATILERKLTVVPHNTWKELGNASFIMLKKDSRG